MLAAKEEPIVLGVERLCKDERERRRERSRAWASWERLGRSRRRASIPPQGAGVVRIAPRRNAGSEERTTTIMSAREEDGWGMTRVGLRHRKFRKIPRGANTVTVISPRWKQKLLFSAARPQRTRRVITNDMRRCCTFLSFWCPGILTESEHYQKFISSIFLRKKYKAF